MRQGKRRPAPLKDQPSSLYWVGEAVPPPRSLTLPPVKHGEKDGKGKKIGPLLNTLRTQRCEDLHFPSHPDKQEVCRQVVLLDPNLTSGLRNAPKEVVK